MSYSLHLFCESPELITRAEIASILTEEQLFQSAQFDPEPESLPDDDTFSNPLVVSYKPRKRPLLFFRYTPENGLARITAEILSYIRPPKSLKERQVAQILRKCAQ